MSWKIKVFNWLADGRITLSDNRLSINTIKESTMAYTLGGVGTSPGQISINPHHSHSSGINFNVTKANGGWIVQINKSAYDSTPELHIIHEDADFDKELGKIVTLSCLKA